MTTPEPEPVYIICNPAAGGGQAARKWEKCYSQLKSRAIPFDFTITQYPGHATEIASELLAQGKKRIAVFGGDGTFNEVIQALFRDPSIPSTEPVLIYLGAGSSCDFERVSPHGMPLVERLQSGQPRIADVCKAEYFNFEGNPITRYFINNSSLGVLSRAGHTFNTATGFYLFLKRISIDLAAIAIGIKTLLEPNEMVCDLRLDGENLANQKISNITVFKTPYFAGGMNYGVATALDDGCLHVGIVESTTRLRLMSMMVSLYTGKIFSRRGTRYHQCRKVEIHTEDRVVVETDGEIIGYPPVKYSLIEKAVNVIV
ncbi:diacylglycerol/lipid kinase family protein [Candidatus Neomarinimicrobiota bacterium]